MIHLPPFTALTIAVLYFIGKSLVPPENRRARFALIVALGIAGLMLISNAVYGLIVHGVEWFGSVLISN